ncbi:cysteine--1-D-myo-inosityl 2-amino-2-deoxy-alpha-D-glucopyranoside ligase [Cellulomonas sp. zg-ZUI222]|uniref:L-cysteine:1D-myo-inositol 2-amino-2-deoxy-alpha-D-glucopyranoside ligase n=1 Tax=Cellulomonas wangleii TaxID=2816956 RepID=A0ABX8D097_9CELL|nr:MULTISPECIES: cysteine--1-D-myo-inosityl 2-amino-2-deoxy-alpha-D-glucopyranoside ligase [Cellulomonas]MBO0900187.1 cysteine--1-D-myo-inosityl 2-amino-2-deoxy-alpha-D-glucopyranoside ligase [Cellulomonas sp. zg-ZUI22]MBO0920899.1 cysteine--1-D-myo-inosityl 2-amino-2-deoxy-alpha-D-glucopyranoside ligase [Cellulomonas wangleii]MBO0925620.1 cysteine--1-D-myo-inosityl 2-amino-2-deoxy-alpha-D-glucopyranoside ligase [Cellulomonas wangleii]QVI60922.1 cysteine--1-D-myo-inosityl 2-amino-2-deoxy-alpha-
MLTWPAPQIPRLPGTGEPVRVHDTSSGQLVVAAPGADARLYVCGITPYDATHLGHAATFIAFDVLGRAWRDAGQRVTYALNVTDVDDPLLERATATGVDWRALAADQTALFASDMAALGVVPPEVFRGVVESVPQVVDGVNHLLARGAAYRLPAPDGGEDVYADLSVDPAFGTVARLDPATMLALSAERGGDPDRPGKRSPLDPLLWRAERPGEPAWDAPGLGRGRPGWHIECSVIARDALGVPFDVQGGGSDLVFPHHECSSSHLRLLDAGESARAHVHTGMVGYEGHKMSKSRGNLVLVSTLLAQGVEPMAVRLAVLAHRYRDDWEWTEADLADAQRRLVTWRRALSGNGGPDAAPVLAEVRAAVADDLDTPRALAVVDAWAATALAGDVPFDEGAPGVVARTIDALLGVRM